MAWDDLDESERERMSTLFDERIYPILTPLAVDPAHPFPYISGLSVNIAALLRDPVSGARQFARIKVPTNVDRFVTLSNGRFVALKTSSPTNSTKCSPAWTSSPGAHSG